MLELDDIPPLGQSGSDKTPREVQTLANWFLLGADFLKNRMPSLIQNGSFSSPTARSVREFSLLLTIRTWSSSQIIFTKAWGPWWVGTHRFISQTRQCWVSGKLSVSVQVSLPQHWLFPRRCLLVGFCLSKLLLLCICLPVSILEALWVLLSWI